jgi:hypothetical protein
MQFRRKFHQCRRIVRSKGRETAFWSRLRGDAVYYYDDHRRAGRSAVLPRTHARPNWQEMWEYVADSRRSEPGYHQEPLLSSSMSSKTRGTEWPRGLIERVGGDSRAATPKPFGSPSTRHTSMIISATRAAGPLKRFGANRMAARKATRYPSVNVSFLRVNDRILTFLRIKNSYRSDIHTGRMLTPYEYLRNHQGSAPHTRQFTAFRSHWTNHSRFVRFCPQFATSGPYGTSNRHRERDVWITVK